MFPRGIHEGNPPFFFFCRKISPFTESGENFFFPHNQQVDGEYLAGPRSPSGSSLPSAHPLLFVFRKYFLLESGSGGENCQCVEILMQQLRLATTKSTGINHWEPKKERKGKKRRKKSALKTVLIKKSALPQKLICCQHEPRRRAAFQTHKN